MSRRQTYIEWEIPVKRELNNMRIVMLPEYVLLPQYDCSMLIKNGKICLIRMNAENYRSFRYEDLLNAIAPYVLDESASKYFTADIDGKLCYHRFKDGKVQHAKEWISFEDESPFPLDTD